MVDKGEYIIFQGENTPKKTPGNADKGQNDKIGHGKTEGWRGGKGEKKEGEGEGRKRDGPTRF